jgi:chemotaxis protein CheD
MSMQIPANLRRVVIHPGDHYATGGNELISTLLGSCVAACLYDPVARVAGMNHFLLANRRYAKNMPLNITDAGRYGVHAMELLINDMYRLGAEKKRIRAKAFGGGAVFEDVSTDNFLCVGEVNERFIREFLRTEGIPLEAEDLGGQQGRVIRFRTDTYAVYRKYIVKGATEKVEKKERGYWEREIADHEAGGEKVFFFS